VEGKKGLLLDLGLFCVWLRSVLFFGFPTTIFV
jgi:hypothetical protein